MKTHTLLGATLLGFALSRPAFAQSQSPSPTPSISSTPNASGVPSIPASGIPGQPGRSTNTVPNVAPDNISRPAGITGSLYSNGLPARNIDGGTQSADQPRSGQAMSGAQPTKRLHKGRVSSPK